VTDDSPLVTIVCGTRNARQSVRLTFASLGHFTPEPKAVLVADNGSTDGTLADLRAITWLDVISLPERRKSDSTAIPEHGATLDWLARQVRTPFFLTLDSDVEFHCGGWLSDVLDLAESGGLAALGVFEPGIGSYRPRLAPFALLLRTAAFRELGTSFRSFVRIEDPAEAARWRARSRSENLDQSEVESYHSAAFYSTGAAVFEQLQRTGAAWAELPPAVSRKFTHHGHMSWAARERRRPRAEHARQVDHIRQRLGALSAVW
jgi:hypothetical protein